jgi:hypothetical protein
VKVFSAFFAEILVRTGLFLHYAHAAAMLPDLADIALDEETAQIVALQFSVCEARLASIGGQARVLQVAAYAACDLVFLCYVIIEVVLELCDIVFIVVLLACSSSGQGRFNLRIESWLFGFL